MRLHHLSIQAFGPFGGTVAIDFDELNTAGQFLISGATGSGKTSILDAVCFALYGEVPGERQRARHLRSDHAAADAEPRVTLTLTLAERLIRITRSPAWERPKRRGAGTTTQQASVRLEQEIDGDWQVLATRLDEAGHMINLWLGMTPTQFTQVALLPQGGFQTFLHAPSAARQAILQRLFRTDRFERVEKWFGEFRRTLNRSCQESLHEIDVIVHRLAEAANGTEPPPVDEGLDSLEGWVNQQRLQVEQDRQGANADHDQAVLTHEEANKIHRGAAEVCAILDRAAVASTQLRELDDSAERAAENTARLAAHERAQTLSPLIVAYTEARALADQAAIEAGAALDAVGLATYPVDDLELLVRDAARECQQAERAGTLATTLDALRDKYQDAQAQWQTTATETARLRSLTETLPRDLATIAQQIQAARDAQVQLASCTAQLHDAQRGLQSATALEQVSAELERTTQLRLANQKNVQDLREAYQDAREARIEAMASELAEGLVVGCSCPVCGSIAHPAPAAGKPGVGRKIEERARRRYEDAGIELTALDEVIAGLQARHDVLTRDAQGRSTSEWATLVTGIDEQHTNLATAVAGLQELSTAEAASQERLASARSDLEHQVRREAQSKAAVDGLLAQIAQAEEELAKALGEDPDAPSMAARTAARYEALQTASDAVGNSSAADATATQQLAILDRQAVLLGFADGQGVRAALLDPENAADLADAQQRREQIRLAATAVLDDPVVQEYRDFPRPDLDTAHRILIEAEDSLAQAQTALHVAQQRGERTRAIEREFAAAAKAYRPLATRAEQVTALSGLLEGTGADNRLRMRLSAFVLAERLRQVVDAANARLETIGEGRYVLHYQEERGARDTRGGLSLSVLDEWTGIQRDPATLSGGETFVVSLCLALGLADTVADECGGLRIDTLFIDEGFGSLDAVTLDSVIDILGQLSLGGRVTGVVSHLQELRERMPAVLEVIPSRTGSTVRMATA